MEPFIVEENKKVTGANIKAIGVGGGGGNMIGHMINQGINGIELLVANTDAQALNTSNAHVKIQLGEKTTRGLGAGMVPEKGKEAALESYDEIKEKLEGADIVFVAAGMGGGTGTGAAPIIAQAAKEVGALTISVVTKPFKFEGRKRSRLAEEGLEELKKESDSIVVIPNDKLLAIVEKNLGIKDSFKIVDDVLARAVSGISGVILSYGQNDINLDFADVKTVMSHRGLALMGVGEAQGSNSAYEAIKSAIESPLLDNMSINGAMGVLVHFTIHPDYPLVDIGEAMDIVYESADEDAHVIFGTTTDENMEPDRVKITLIATGFDHEEEKKEELKLVTPKQTEIVTTKVKVSGSDFDNTNEEVLDIPTFLRKQMD
ncbi:cell division protein FtsZ [Nitrosophilus kaiyonis]|uniref:cell division protein FtsZ n=1 Tax=Nitrosophilus kaiyonis TaxID=2930200 RepID=UPI002493A688|nr:cell division protein FtsZ [Nitrosophilus kaiyonis]